MKQYIRIKIFLVTIISLLTSCNIRHTEINSNEIKEEKLHIIEIPKGQKAVFAWLRADGMIYCFTEEADSNYTPKNKYLIEKSLFNKDTKGQIMFKEN